MLVVGLVGGPGAADEVAVVEEAARLGATTWLLAPSTRTRPRGTAGEVSLHRRRAASRGAPAAARPPGPCARARPRADARLRPGCAPPSRPGRDPRTANDRRRPAARRLSGRGRRSGCRPTRSRGRGSRSSTPTTTSGPRFGGEWATRPPAELVADARRVRRRDDRRPRRRPGRGALGRDRAMAGGVPGPGRRRSPASTTTLGDRSGVRRDGGGAAAGLRRARRPRAQGLEAARAAGTRPGRPAGRGRRPAARPALGGGRGARISRSSSTSPTRSRSSSRSTRRTSAGRSCTPIPTGISGRPGRPTSRTPRAFPRSTSCWRPSSGWSRAIRGRRSSAPTSAAPPRTSALVGAAARRAPEPPRRHRRAARRARPPAVHRPGRSSSATRIGSCSAWTWRRIPAIYAIHYRFLETFDESFDYGTEPVPAQGRWQIHGIGLPDDVLRKVYRDNARRLFAMAPA